MTIFHVWNVEVRTAEDILKKRKHKSDVIDLQKAVSLSFLH